MRMKKHLNRAPTHHIFRFGVLRMRILGLLGMVKAAGAFTNDGSVRASLQQANIEAMMLPVALGLEGYTLPNLIYQNSHP